jgi:hypothetical protein
MRRKKPEILDRNTYVTDLDPQTVKWRLCEHTDPDPNKPVDQAERAFVGELTHDDFLISSNVGPVKNRRLINAIGVILPQKDNSTQVRVYYQFTPLMWIGLTLLYLIVAGIAVALLVMGSVSVVAALVGLGALAIATSVSAAFRQARNKLKQRLDNLLRLRPVN